MNKSGVIYMATSKTSGKSYIGQTQKSLNDRINKHFYSVRHNSNLYFHDSSHHGAASYFRELPGKSPFFARY